MLQLHTMILWSKPKEKDFENLAKTAYRIMEVLKEFGSEVEPKYLTVNRKKDAVPFEWSYENFRNTLKKGVNKEGDVEFPELGYSIDFFSSLESQHSSSIRMKIGNQNSEFVDNLVIQFPKFYSLEKINQDKDKIKVLFNQCIHLFQPYWGCISNSMNIDRFDNYVKNDKPLTLHWLNYWGEDILRNIPAIKAMSVPVYYTEPIEKGWFIQLKDDPLDDTLEEDVQLQAEANKYYGLLS